MFASCEGIAEIGNGRSLSYQLRGAGGPTVVLESGLGASSLEWAAIAPHLAKTTTVLTYDRAGFGRSTPAPAPHTGMQMAADCVQLLSAIEAPAPYLLVGHSWGGVVARFVTDRIADRIAGMILVDAPHEALRISAPSVALLKFNCRRQAKRAASGKLARAVASGKRRRLQTLLAHYPRPVQERFIGEYCTPEFHRAAQAELDGLTQSLRRLGTLPPPKVPVVAITGAGTDHWTQRRARVKMTRIYSQLARDWPAASHVLAPNSGHFVPQDDAELLIEIITTQIDRARATAAEPLHTSPTSDSVRVKQMPR